MNNFIDTIKIFAFDKGKVFKDVAINKNNADLKSLTGVFNEVFFWAGVVAVITIVIAGIFYIISRGDPGKISKAKNALTFSVIGLILVLLAGAIVNFVLGVL